MFRAGSGPATCPGPGCRWEASAWPRKAVDAPGHVSSDALVARPPLALLLGLWGQPRRNAL